MTHATFASMFRSVTVLTSAVLACTALAACGGGDTEGGAPASAAPASGSPSATAGTAASTRPSGAGASTSAATAAGPAGEATTAPSAGAGSDSAAGAASACPASSLSAAVTPQEGGGAAGSFYYAVTLTNTGTTTCTLTGYPGVSYLDAAGAEVGRPADRDGSAAQAVTLTPGASASADLRVTSTDAIGSCDPVQASQVRVYPPDQTESLTTAAELSVCGASVSTTIGVMQPVG